MEVMYMKKREVIARYILTVYDDGSIHKEKMITDEIKEYVAYGKITESWDRMFCILYSTIKSKQFLRAIERYREREMDIEYKGVIYKLNYSRQLPRFTGARRLIESMKEHGEYAIGSTIKYVWNTEDEKIILTVEK